MLNTVTLTSIDDGLLRTNTGCADPTFSITLYIDWLNITIIPKSLMSYRNTGKSSDRLVDFHCSFKVICCYYNGVMRKSHEQRLITKEHIAMHTHLKSALVIKLFKCSVLKLCYYCNTVSQSPLKALLPLGMCSILLVIYNWLNISSCLQGIHDMLCSKIIPIATIDGKCDTKRLKSEICLTGYSGFNFV